MTNMVKISNKTLEQWKFAIKEDINKICRVTNNHIQINIETRQFRQLVLDEATVMAKQS